MPFRGCYYTWPRLKCNTDHVQFRASRTVRCSEPCQRKQWHHEPKEVIPGPSSVSPQLNLLWLYQTPSHTWLGLLPANLYPDSQEVKLGNTFNTVWIPGLWSIEGILAYEWKLNGDAKPVIRKVGRALAESILVSLIILLSWLWHDISNNHWRWRLLHGGFTYDCCCKSPP